MSVANIKPLIPGQTWLTGASAPDPQFGYKTQFYLNLTNGDVYQKVDTLIWTVVGSISGSGLGLVTSVNGQTGAVNLTTSEIPEGINQYFTDTRARTAAVIDSTAGGQIDQAPSVHATNELVINAVALEAAARAAADALLIPLTQKGVADGVATLDNTGKIPSSQIPATAITSVTVVATIAERDALSAGEGDFCVVTDTNQTFIYNGTGWTELIIGSSVVSVNGQTGAVSLSTTEISEGTNLYYTDARAKLASVINSSAGNETDLAMSVAAAKMFTTDSVQTETLAREAADALLIPLTQKGVADGVATLGVDGKVPSTQLPASPGSPVTSVNGKIGDVILTTEDIAESGTNYYFTVTRARNAAVVDSTAGSETDQAPSVSSIKAYIAALPSGVLSVNGLTGIVTITAASLDALSLSGGTLTGALYLGPIGVNTGETGIIHFNELAINGSNYVALRAPDSLGSNIVWTLPAIDGTNGQVLTTNGAGILEWSSSGASVTSVNSQTGVVVLTTTNIAEGVDLYFTDLRARNAIIGAASSITSANLTSDRALISDGSGKVSTSTVTSTELSYLSGVSSSVQTQISGKVSKSGDSMTGALTLNAQNELRFADSDSSNWVGFKSPGTVSSNTIWTLPEGDGTNGQALSTNGVGVLSWASIPSTANFVQKSGDTMTGALIMGPTGISAGSGGVIRFRELAVNGANFVGLKAADSIVSDVTWTLPSADGTSGQFLSTNGIGTLSWSSVSSPAATVSTKTNSYTLQASDSGSVINMTNPGSASITVPSGLATNFNCKIIRSGGPVKIVPSFTTINSNTLGTMFSSANSKLDLQGCSLDTYNLSGDLNIPLYGCAIDGTVFAQVIVGNFAFIGGSFTRITDSNGNVYSRSKIAKINIIDGTIDSTFDPVNGFDGTVYALRYVNVPVLGLSDCLYVGGDFTVYYGPAASFNARITKLDGTTAQPDTSFSASANSTVYSIDYTTSAGNGLFAAGAFTTYNSTTRQYIVKMNLSTGAIDTSFDSASGFNFQVNSITVDSTVVYAGGNFSSYKGTARQCIAKLNSLTAALDTTFDSATGFNNWVRVVHQMNSAGELFVGGEFTSYKGTTRQYIAKLNASTAALDTTFDSASGFNTIVRCIASASNTFLYVGGNFTSYKGTIRERVAKISASDASVDFDFNSSSGFNNIVYAVNTSFNGTALNVAGSFTSYKGNTGIKYACKLDTTYGQIFNNYIVMGLRFNGDVSAMVISGNFAYVGGSFNNVTDVNGNIFNRLYIAKINYLTGEVDTTFDASTGFNSPVNSLILSGTDLYVGGNFTSYKGTTRQYIAKINATTAALDTTFDSLSGFSSGVNSIVLSGTDLYVGGLFTAYKGTTRQRIAKINATTAALDTTFDSLSGFSAGVNSIVLDGSGNLYAGGGFITYKGTGRQYIAKINATTAALDATFDSLSGFDNGVYSIVLSGTDLYVGGLFTAYKGTTRQRIAKINATTAALDATFDSLSGFDNGVYSIVLSGTDLYLGGGFITYKGTGRRNIAKINATTAALNTTFNSATGLESSVNVILLSGSSLYFGGTSQFYKSTINIGYWGILNSTNASLTSYTVV